MPHLNTARLATFARLIALGYPPVLAAKAAGYRNLRASRAATRLSQPPAAVDEPKTPRAAPAKATRAAAPSPPPQSPPQELEPMLTVEQWMLKYHPKYRDQAGASA
jgi:hypothetical protein